MGDSLPALSGGGIAQKGSPVIDAIVIDATTASPKKPQLPLFLCFKVIRFF